MNFIAIELPTHVLQVATHVCIVGRLLHVLRSAVVKLRTFPIITVKNELTPCFAKTQNEFGW